jgi:hypothetical protein
VRQFFSWRYWAAVGSLVVLLFLLWAFRGNSSPAAIVEEANTRRVDLIARTSTVRSDAPWSVADGVSRGNATAVLQNGRLLTIADGTLGQSSCLSPEVLDACVLLADTLGDGIIWFALVPAPPAGSAELELPPIVALLDGVTYARLDNGWEVPLLDRVVRRCDDETPNLSAFVERFGTRHVTIVDLEESQVSAVRCN